MLHLLHPMMFHQTFEQWIDIAVVTNSIDVMDLAHPFEHQDSESDRQSMVSVTSSPAKLRPVSAARVVCGSQPVAAIMKGIEKAAKQLVQSANSLPASLRVRDDQACSWRWRVAFRLCSSCGFLGAEQPMLPHHPQLRRRAGRGSGASAPRLT